MSSPILAALAPRTPVAFLGEAVDQAGGETWLNVATANGLMGWVRGFDLDPIDEADTSGSHATTSPQGSALAADPVVGSWSERRNRGDHLTFFADGNVLLTDADGQTYHGAWQRVDRPGLIGTYVVEAWRRDGGEGRLGPIVRVSTDELDLGNAVYDRLIPPTPADLGLPGGAGVSATPTPPEAPPGGAAAAPGASPGATPVADEAAAADDPFPGVAVEDLVNIAHLPGRLVLGQVSLTRVTMQPGAVFAYSFPAPVLLAVEEGTLTLDVIGRGVTSTSPPEVVPNDGRQRSVREGEGVITSEVGGTTVRQRTADLAPRETASVGAGGSIYGEGGGIGRLRNDGDQPLVLLLVALAPEGRTWGVTVGGRRDAAPAPSRSGDERGAHRPTPCRVAPRTQAEVERIVAAAGPPREPRFADEPSALPVGEPADRETVAAITALEREFAGCIKAFDYPRWLALQTDRVVGESVAPGDVADLFAGVGDPAAFHGEGIETAVAQDIVSVEVRDVRVLADGRIGAVVEWRGPRGRSMQPTGDVIVVADETDFRIYERVGGRWRIDEEISGNI